jgi:uncharacterized protein YciI
MKKTLIFSLVILTFVSCKKEQKSSIHDITEDAKETVEKVIDTIKVDIVKAPLKKTIKQIKEELNAKGFQTFDYVDKKTKDTILMQQYFMAFLKRGPIQNQNEEESALLQKEHRAYLGKMYELGYADISGPFGDDGDILGITIYNVATQKMADSLANIDPMVKAGRLEIEMHPWWAVKGFSLR